MEQSNNKKISESNVDDLVNGRDGLTSLCVIISASLGSDDCCDLSSFYGLMIMSTTSMVNVS